MGLTEIIYTVLVLFGAFSFLVVSLFIIASKRSKKKNFQKFRVNSDYNKSAIRVVQTIKTQNTGRISYKSARMRRVS